MDFSLSDAALSGTVNAGQPEKFTVAVSPDGGFSQPISFECVGAPTAGSCSVAPSSITSNGSTFTRVAVSVTTAARSLATPAFPKIPARPSLPNPTALRIRFSFMAAALLSIGARRERRRMVRSLCCVAVLAILARGCAGSVGGNISPPSLSGGTPAGTYVLTGIGTSGSIAHTTSFTLKVN
jgi:hypothetical protein